MGDVAPWVIAAIPLALIALVWCAAALAQLFEKAGEPGWQAWVPVRNAAVFLRLGGFGTAWLLLLLVPVVGWIALGVLAAVAAHRVGRALGHRPGMTVLAVLLPPVWLSVAGWGTSRYVGPEHRAARRHRTRRAAVRRAAEPAGPWPFGDAGAPGAAPRVAPRPALAPPPTPAPPSAFAPPAAPAPPSAFAPPAPAPAFASPERFAPVVPPPPLVDPRPAPAAAPDALPQDVVRPAVRTPAPRDPRVPEAIWSRLEAPAPSAAPPSRAPRAPQVPPRPPVPTPSAPSVGPALVALPPRPASPLPDTGRTYDAMLHADTTERGVRFRLVLDGGETIELTRSVAIVGRNPASDPAYPEAQLVQLRDGTRTLSKTHARIERREDGWIVVDLGSTNGVFVVDIDGSEYDATPGSPARVPERLLLGTVELRVAGAA